MKDEAAWVTALNACTYHKILKERQISHDEFWREYGIYDEMIRHSGYPGEIVPTILSRIEPGSTILDIGAGTGAFAIPLTEAGHHVIALDPSEYHLSILTSKGECETICSLWDEKAAREIPPVDYTLAAYSFIDEGITDFLRRAIDHGKKGSFLIYRAGERDPLLDYAGGPAEQISYRHITGILEALGVGYKLDGFIRDFHLPFDLALKRARNTLRTEEEIRTFLRDHQRLHMENGNLQVAFRDEDMLITIRQ